MGKWYPSENPLLRGGGIFAQALNQKIEQQKLQKQAEAEKKADYQAKFDLLEKENSNRMAIEILRQDHEEKMESIKASREGKSPTSLNTRQQLLQSRGLLNAQPSGLYTPPPLPISIYNDKEYMAARTGEAEAKKKMLLDKTPAILEGYNPNYYTPESWDKAFKAKDPKLLISSKDTNKSEQIKFNNILLSDLFDQIKASQYDPKTKATLQSQYDTLKKEQQALIGGTPNPNPSKINTTLSEKAKSDIVRAVQSDLKTQPKEDVIKELQADYSQELIDEIMKLATAKDTKIKKPVNIPGLNITKRAFGF